MITLKTKIEKLPSVGAAYIKRLHKIGVENVNDLLFYFPFRYDDFSNIKKINEIELGETVSVKGRIVDIQNTKTWKRKMNITEAIVEDDSGAIKVVWFNQPFLIYNLKKNTNVSLSGKVVYSQDGLQISNPAYEFIGRQLTHTARLISVYHETNGLSSRWIREHIKPLVKLSSKIDEFMPYEVIKRQNLFGISEAVRQMHFPKNTEAAAAAKRRLAFDEIFLVQLHMLRQKQKWHENNGVKIVFDEKIKNELKSFVKNLPFKLTNAQKISSWKIIKDMEKGSVMNRLLEGDVGSGKTLVALISSFVVIRRGYQAAFMSPTEILSRQHFFEAIKRFGKENQSFDITIALLTKDESRIYKKGVEKIMKKDELLKKIKDGEVNFIIGTHFLIQEKVIFKNLALSIVDEQHRFGIKQRAKMQKRIANIKGELKTVPHLLSMTATPIPRTLALAIYGDLDISILDEMPKGRQKIITKLISAANRKDAYLFVRNQIKKGRQVFVICPLIDESDILEVKSANKEYERIKNEVYPDLEVGLLHGKMKLKEKEETMEKFSSGKINVLISTSVVEVGIDVPNANVMIIEGADRFGLAQLHQFRGRVGRGKHRSYCFLFTDSTSAKTHKRLKALLESSSGFELAEKDLKIRGPGELVGIRQSGLPDIAMSSLADYKLIRNARNEAKIIIENEKLEKYPKLKSKLEKFEKNIHLE